MVSSTTYTTTTTKTPESPRIYLEPVFLFLVLQKISAERLLKARFSHLPSVIQIPLIKHSSSSCRNCSADRELIPPLCKQPFLSYVGLNFRNLYSKGIALSPYNFQSFVIIISPGTIKNKSSESSDFSYGTTLNIWRCLSSFPSLHQFFSELNVLSFYKYFSFACQLPTWYVTLLCTVYRWHVIIKHPFRVPSSPSYSIIIHIIYDHTGVVGAHSVLWTAYRVESPLKR